MFKKDIEEWKEIWKINKEEILRMKKEKFRNECEYQGQRENGILNGIGIVFWINGDRYEGQLKMENEMVKESTIMKVDSRREIDIRDSGKIDYEMVKYLLFSGGDWT